MRRKTGRNHGDAHLVLHRLVKCSAPDNVRILMRLGRNHRGSRLDLVEANVRGRGNIDDNALCAVDRCLEERAEIAMFAATSALSFPDARPTPICA